MAKLKHSLLLKLTCSPEAVFPLMPEYEFCELEPEVVVKQNGMVRHCELQHPGGSTGFRIDLPECSFAYITDSYVNNTYTEFIRGVDILVHECYFPRRYGGMV